MAVLAVSSIKSTHRYIPRGWLYWPIAIPLEIWFRLTCSWKVVGMHHLPTRSQQVYDELGGTRLRQPSYVLAVKHSSMRDIYLLGATLHRPMAWMAKARLVKYPLVWRYLCNAGVIPVCRPGGDDGYDHVGLTPDEALKKMELLVKLGFPATIYCEGTRSDPRIVGEVRTGAIRLAMATGEQLIPVGVAGTKGPARRDIFGRRLSVIVFGPPIDPSNYWGEYHDKISAIRKDLQIAVQTCTDQGWSLLEKR